LYSNSIFAEMTNNTVSIFKGLRVKITVVFWILLLLILNTCRKDEEADNFYQKSEVLDPTEIAYLDKLETSHYTADDIVLPGGSKLSDFLEEMDPELYNRIYNLKKSEVHENKLFETKPFQQKNLLLAKMLGTALILTNRNMFNYPDEGPDSPAQHGLAYSYGQKDYTKRQPPPASDLTICRESIYGLDCSGFIYQLAKNAGVTLTNDPYGECNAQFESDTLTWANAFRNSADYQKLHTEDLGKLPVADIQVGDLIFWLRDNLTSYHVGMVLYASESAGAAVYMSCGCATGCDEQGCIDNFSDKRGPRQVLLSDPKWFNKNYKILRIKADMFPYKNVQFRVSSKAIFSYPTREVTGNFFVTANFVLKSSGSKLTGLTVYNYNTQMIDSLEIELDPELFQINSFKFRRKVVGPSLGDYTHYERMYIVKKGSPIQGKLDYWYGTVSGANFSVSGAIVENLVDVNYEWNLRENIEIATWVISDGKLKKLIGDQTSQISLYFVP